MAKDLVRTRRYIQKFYQMKTQLQAVGLRIQVRSKLETGRGVAVVAVTDFIVGRGLSMTSIS